MNRNQPASSLDETIGFKDLRTDVRVDSQELEVLIRADAGHHRCNIGTRHTELLIFSRGGQVFVGMSVHAGVDSDAHRLNLALRLGCRSDALEFDVAVDHDRTNAGSDRSTDFGE